jgi:hypothetical protein
LKISRFKSRRHRGLIARATKAPKLEPFVARAISPRLGFVDKCEFFNSPTGTYYWLLKVGCRAGAKRKHRKIEIKGE